MTTVSGMDPGREYHMSLYDTTLASRLIDGDRDDEAPATFSRLNDAGQGFNPDDDDLAEWELVSRAANMDEVSIYADGDDAILVGDAGGLWAVRVSA